MFCAVQRKLKRHKRTGQKRTEKLQLRTRFERFMYVKRAFFEMQHKSRILLYLYMRVHIMYIFLNTVFRLFLQLLCFFLCYLIHFFS